VIDLSAEQIRNFAGNAIELSGRGGRLLVMSQRALDSLTPGQKLAIGHSVRLVGLSVPTVELAGGSVRCMLAGIHLAPREPAKTERLVAQAVIASGAASRDLAKLETLQ
jgi:hypothetical protein